MENLCINCKTASLKQTGGGICLHPAAPLIVINNNDTCEKFVAKNQKEIFNSEIPRPYKRELKRFNPGQQSLF